jgi:hypothetical protein
MSGTHGTSWQPLRTFKHTTPVVPPVADGPGVSPISACGRRRAQGYSHAEKTRTTNITRHEAEPAFSGSVIVATSFHGDFDVKHEICNKHLFLSGARQCDELGSRLLAIHPGKPSKADGKLRPSFRPSRTARVFR